MGFTGLGPPRLLKAVLLESNSVSALAIPKVTVLDTVGAVSLLAVTALTKRRWLYWVALIPTAAGTLMGLAGLIGWSIHPDFLIRLLS